ncbi:MAG: acylphosphatase [Alphaproteobacteria bacterium]|nr:acylphosphatase [Alphaproteobacteria bacterium]
MEARRVVISGRVQGVGFRAWAVQEARTLGLTGWVRNLRNGKVEAHIQGPGDKVQQMIAACHRGPGLSVVDTVAIRDSLEEHLDDFQQRPTA